MANTYSFNQISTILNNLVADAQGRTPNISTTPRDTSSFVTLGQTALSMGTDPIMHAINQMINKTIFAYRPYEGALKILDVDDLTYGNMVRKITHIFFDSAQEQQMYNNAPSNGTSADHWKVKTPKALQTNFIGAEQWDVQAPTVFVDQLNTAFSSPEQLGEFLSTQVGEVINDIEQQLEVLRRGTVANFIGTKCAKDADNCYKVLTIYNNLTGLSLDAKTVMKPENFQPFTLWLLGFVRNLSDKMVERGEKFHQNLTATKIPRHTPKGDQRLILYNPYMVNAENMSFSGVYHENLLTRMPYTGVTFWQNMNQPEGINITPSVLNTDGTVEKGPAQKKDHVLGILYDKQAMGVNLLNQGVDMTPINAKARYYNTFHHMVRRYWNDPTENACVFLLE